MGRWQSCSAWRHREAKRSIRPLLHWGCGEICGEGQPCAASRLQVTEKLVGPNGLEPSTSSVSRKRSNQLSYGPATGQISFYGEFRVLQNESGRSTRYLSVLGRISRPAKAPSNLLQVQIHFGLPFSSFALRR